MALLNVLEIFFCPFVKYNIINKVRIKYCPLYSKTNVVTPSMANLQECTALLSHVHKPYYSVYGGLCFVDAAIYLLNIRIRYLRG